MDLLGDPEASGGESSSIERDNPVVSEAADADFNSNPNINSGMSDVDNGNSGYRNPDPFALSDEEEEPLERDTQSYLFKRPGQNFEGETDITITLPNGDRYYMMVNGHNDPFKSSGYTPASNLEGILDCPIKEMMQEIEREEIERIVDEAERKGILLGEEGNNDEVEMKSSNDQLSQTKENEEANDTEMELEGKSAKEIRKEQKKRAKEERRRKREEQLALKRRQQLWVDRYAPKRFLDLVSNEKTNRFVLQWVKSWDPYVFNIKPKSNKNNVNPAGTHFGFSRPEDNDIRPFKKVILLAGPPGLGKTTLAYVVATHSGYCPVEINASDERTGSVLRERITNAMEMQSSFGDDRPKCLILDEVEGVANQGEGKGAVQVILDLLKPRTVNRKTKKKSKVITRPLICICNDAYASVLRPLRTHESVMVVHLKPPSVSSAGTILGRLKFVCEEEELLAKPGALQSLCREMEYDIRGCIHSLQFIKSKSDFVSLDLVNKFCANQRDKKSHLFESLNHVFKVAARNKPLQHQQSDEKKADFRNKESVELINTLGKHGSDFAIVLDAMNENLLNVRFSDALLSNTYESLDWITFADVIYSNIQSKQRYYLTPYLPFSGLAIKSMCKCDAGSRASFPKGHIDFRNRAKENANILEEFQTADLAPLRNGSNQRNMLSRGQTAKYASLYCGIMFPTLRPGQNNLIDFSELRENLCPLKEESYEMQERKGQNQDSIVKGGNLEKTDFFGRTLPKPENNNKKRARDQEESCLANAKRNTKKKVNFIYEAGYTNAVRRPVKIYDFLL